MTLPEWKNSGSYFTYKGHRIFYQDAGEGPAILLIHGFPTASWDWNLVWPRLSEEHRLIAPDMIGFGFSDKPMPYDYSIFDQADLHLALLEKLGISDIHILAHDYGDTVAQELLARQQEGQGVAHLRSVCFLNGGLFPGVHRPRPIQRLLMSPLGPWLTPFLGKRSLKNTFHRIFGPHTQPTAQQIDEFWELVAHDDGVQAIPQLIHYMDERVQHQKRWGGALQETMIPLRLIDGAADPISGRHLADYYRQIIPHPDVVVLEDIGHYPQVEAPEAVLQHYLTFLPAT